MTGAKRLFAGLLMAALAGCQPAATPSQTKEVSGSSDQSEAAQAIASPQERAIAARDALFKQLSTRLVNAMSNGGPASAIEVCGTEAPRIAMAVGEEFGVAIGRTSFRLRNPKNQPPPWAGTLIDERPTETRFVELPDGRTGALLPIMLKSQCLVCHGPDEQIAEKVKTQLTKQYPDDQATGFEEGDLRGWFWVEVPAGAEAEAARGDDVVQAEPQGEPATADSGHGGGHGPGRGRGHGMGRGMMGRGPGAGMRGDMITIHTMFDNRDKIRRTVKSLPDGAEALTESDDEEIASLIQEHVPAMEGRVIGNEPLPPMTFHPIFVGLIKHADDYTLAYEETDKGVKVTYRAADPYVIMLVQEHARLVSRFIKNGMEEIHKPYTLPATETAARPAADAAAVGGEDATTTSPPATTSGPKSQPAPPTKSAKGDER